MIAGAQWVKKWCRDRERERVKSRGGGGGAVEEKGGGGNVINTPN